MWGVGFNLFSMVLQGLYKGVCRAVFLGSLKSFIRIQYRGVGYGVPWFWVSGFL